MLEPLYYRPVGTYRAANFGHNLMRSYIRPGDPARCVVMVVEHKANTGGGSNVNQAWQYEFMTRFADGRLLSTSNMRLKSVLDSPGELVKQSYPSLRDPAQIKKYHDARAAIRRKNSVMVSSLPLATIRVSACPLPRSVSGPAP